MVEKRDFPANEEALGVILEWVDGLSNDEIREAVRDEIPEENRWEEDLRMNAEDEMVEWTWSDRLTLSRDMKVTRKIPLDQILPKMLEEVGNDEKHVTAKIAALLLCPGAFIKDEEGAGAVDGPAEAEARDGDEPENLEGTDGTN